MAKKELSWLSGLAVALILAGAGCTSDTNIATKVETDNLQVEQSATSQIQTPSENNNAEKKPTEIKVETKTEIKTVASTSAKMNTPAQVSVPPVTASATAEVKAEVNTKVEIPVVKEFTITAKSWEFSPGTITVNKGDKVRLKITSTDVTHSFLLTDYSVNTKLEPGQTQIVEFTADKVGSFSFRCGVPCGSGHKEMTGTLIVK